MQSQSQSHKNRLPSDSPKLRKAVQPMTLNWIGSPTDQVFVARLRDPYLCAHSSHIRAYQKGILSLGYQHRLTASLTCRGLLICDQLEFYSLTFQLSWLPSSWRQMNERYHVLHFLKWWSYLRRLCILIAGSQHTAALLAAQNLTTCCPFSYQP